jgi:hypothetical protein
MVAAVDADAAAASSTSLRSSAPNRSILLTSSPFSSSPRPAYQKRKRNQKQLEINKSKKEKEENEKPITDDDNETEMRMEKKGEGKERKKKREKTQSTNQEDGMEDSWAAGSVVFVRVADHIRIESLPIKLIIITAVTLKRPTHVPPSPFPRPSGTYHLSIPG